MMKFIMSLKKNVDLLKNIHNSRFTGKKMRASIIRRKKETSNGDISIFHLQLTPKKENECMKFLTRSQSITFDVRENFLKIALIF